METIINATRNGDENIKRSFEVIREQNGIIGQSAKTMEKMAISQTKMQDLFIKEQQKNTDLHDKNEKLMMKSLEEKNAEIVRLREDNARRGRRSTISAIKAILSDEEWEVLKSKIGKLAHLKKQVENKEIAPITLDMEVATMTQEGFSITVII